MKRCILFLLFLYSLTLAGVSNIACPANAFSYANSTCIREVTYSASGGVMKVGSGSTTTNKVYDIWDGFIGTVTTKDIQVVKNYGGSSNTLRIHLNSNVKSWSNLPYGFKFSVPKFVGTPSANLGTSGYKIHVYHKRFADGKDFLQRMDKPIVICQGFDPNYGIVKKGRTLTMGAKDMENILGLKYIQKMIDDGYSVVVVNFSDPTLSIDGNAYAALDALKWVQQQAVQKDMVVVGPSMGGLIMRKALILAAETNAAIHPRLFIAYDSPNWGAVIPAAIQAAIHFNRDEGKNERRSYNNLTSAAASQMMLYQIKGTSTSIDGYFASDNGSLRNFGSANYLRALNSASSWQKLRSLKSFNSTPIRVVAVTDGTPSTKQGLTVDKKYCDYDYYTLDWEMATTNPGVLKQITRFDPANMWERKYKFKEPVFTENLPGGLRDSYTAVKAALRQEDFYGGGWDPGTSPFLDVGSWGKNTLTGDVEMQKITTYKGHAFIPTASAAGIKVDQYSDFNKESTWLLPSGTKTLDNTKSMFDAVYLAESNWNHVSPYNEQSSSPVHATIFNVIQKGSP